MPENSVPQPPQIERSEWSDIDVFSDLALQAVNLARRTGKPEAVVLAQDALTALRTRVHRVNWRNADDLEPWEAETDPTPPSPAPAYAERVH